MVDEGPSFTQFSMPSPLVFDSVYNKDDFPPLNDSNRLGAVDYDAHINTKIDYSINRVFISMTAQELNTINHICKLEGAQLSTKLAISVQNPQLDRYLLTGNRSNFLQVEGSNAWLYDFPQLFSPLYEANKCFKSFDPLPI